MEVVEYSWCCLVWFYSWCFYFAAAGKSSSFTINLLTLLVRCGTHLGQVVQLSGHWWEKVENVPMLLWALFAMLFSIASRIIATKAKRKCNNFRTVRRLFASSSSWILEGSASSNAGKRPKCNIRGFCCCILKGHLPHTRAQDHKKHGKWSALLSW